VVGREVDAADEGGAAVDDDDLAVHAPQHVQAHAEDAGRGIEAAQTHSGLGERPAEGRREVARAEAVDQDVDLDAATSRRHELGLQRQADLVLEDDEGLDDHLAPRCADRLEHGREVRLAVLEQADPVAAAPARAHRPISAASGA
jgi:hypothetical protein